MKKFLKIVLTLLAGFMLGQFAQYLYKHSSHVQSAKNREAEKLVVATPQPEAIRPPVPLRPTKEEVEQAKANRLEVITRSTAARERLTSQMLQNRGTVPDNEVNRADIAKLTPDDFVALERAQQLAHKSREAEMKAFTNMIGGLLQLSEMEKNNGYR